MLAFLACLVACVGPTFIVQQFRGPQRPASEIAILRVNGGDSVRLLLLDDEDVAAPIPDDGRLHIEVLPARHTVVVTNASAAVRSPPLVFVAEAGKVYRVAWASEGNARIFEVGRSNDAIVRDVTMADALPSDPIPGPTREPDAE